MDVRNTQGSVSRVNQKNAAKRCYPVTETGNTIYSDNLVLQASAAVTLLKEAKTYNNQTKSARNSQINCNLTLVLVGLIFLSSLAIYYQLQEIGIETTADERAKRGDLAKQFYTNKTVLHDGNYLTCFQAESELDCSDSALTLQHAHCESLRKQICKFPSASILEEMVSAFKERRNFTGLLMAILILTVMHALHNLFILWTDKISLPETTLTPDERKQIQLIGQMLKISIPDDATVDSIVRAFNNRLDELMGPRSRFKWAGTFSQSKELPLNIHHVAFKAITLPKKNK